MEGIKDSAATAVSKMKCQHLLTALLQLEQRYNASSSTSTTTTQHVLQYSQTTIRQSIVQWYQQIIASIDNDESAGSAGLPRDVSFIAIRLLDRMIGSVPAGMTSNPPTLKLIAFTCLYVAIKIYYKKCGLMNTDEERRAFLLHGSSSSRISSMVSIQQLLNLTSLDIPGEQIKATELWLLQQVNWSICPLTPGLFMKCIIPCIDWTLFDEKQDQLQQCVLETSLRLGELATQDSFFIPYNVSAIALTCVIAAASIETQRDSSCALNETVLQAFAPLLKHTVEELQELHVLCLKLCQLYHDKGFSTGRRHNAISALFKDASYTASSGEHVSTTMRKQEGTSNNNEDNISIRNNDHNDEATSSNDSTSTSSSSSSSSSSIMNVSMDTSSLEEENHEPNVNDDQDDVLPLLEIDALQDHLVVVQPQPQPQPQPQQRLDIANHNVHVIPYEHNEI